MRVHRDVHKKGKGNASEKKMKAHKINSCTLLLLPLQHAVSFIGAASYTNIGRVAKMSRVGSNRSS